MEAVILAGGAATRMGGADKVMLPLAPEGISLLQHAVDQCWTGGATAVFVVGPERPGLERVTRWVQDRVPGAGPAAGLFSALAHVRSDLVMVCAGDQLIDAAHVNHVTAAAAGHDGAWAVRHPGTSVLERGNAQPLFACVQAQVLREVLEPTRGVNQSPLRLLAPRDMVAVELSHIADVDTWHDVALIAQGANMTHAWLARMSAAVGMPMPDVPVDDLLDLTRDVAHGVERKAAPLTTYLLGIAVGSGVMTADQAVAAAREAVTQWQSDGK